jgi:hypothetical protein
MYLVMDTYTLPSGYSNNENVSNNLEIPDIPLNKWVNIIIICKNNTINVYVNGIITKSEDLEGIPKQNYGDVFIAPNGGFSGNISNLQYFNHALGTTEISKIINKGPNTNFIGSNSINIKNYNYLSLRWFFYGASNGYNP